MTQDPDAIVPEPAHEPEPRRRRSRARRVIRIAGFSILGLIAAAIVTFLVWTNITYPAAPDGLAAAETDDRISLGGDDNLVVMSPAGGESEQGLVFLAGAKVEPKAYVSTFRDLAAAGVTVVIVRPILNLAIIEWRDLSEFTAAAPEVEAWAVGGHSAGGVKACSYAEDAAVTALVLFASYCAFGDLSGRDDLSALSITGTRDGVLSLDSFEDARSLMPPDTIYVELDGVNHAQFGDYGDQPGDSPSTISNDEAHALISDALIEFFAAQED
ncbi:alpha/beta hydrolase [Microbacterium sp. SLBN-146]|uniref:alpha/beta hydrolase n=1 Tax=Microbacterium sp. SLBN-146 TaxID=2768457 RepID=UPI001172BBAD|nr:alpha/beta hydrolase [Microbacterium sp. SLBN-146]TQJ30743.1 alpha/beta hydrolase family protein [Microbacterium sp. SLBN-146]